MTTEELAALARAQPNPFAGSVLRNGFEPPQADVPEIHAEQRRQLRALVEEVRQTGRLALQVVTGEPGDGKTHLLATLRAEAEGSWGTTGAERVMVPIDPLRDPDAPFVHVLQGLVRGLRRPLGRQPPVPDSLATPLDRILWGILQRAVQESPEPACSAVAALFGPYPSAAARSVLLTLLSKARTVGDTAIVAARTSGHGLEVKAARGGRERRAYVEASNSRHGMAAKAVARRLQEALAGHDRVLLVRDARIPLPPMAFGMVEALGERAAIVSVDEESGRAFSGIEGLLNGAESQDIEVPREVALQVVVERIAPSLSALHRLLDAVTGPVDDSMAPPPAPR